MSITWNNVMGALLVSRCRASLQQLWETGRKIKSRLLCIACNWYACHIFMGRRQKIDSASDNVGWNVHWVGSGRAGSHHPRYNMWVENNTCRLRCRNGMSIVSDFYLLGYYINVLEYDRIIVNNRYCEWLSISRCCILSIWFELVSIIDDPAWQEKIR